MLKKIEKNIMERFRMVESNKNGDIQYCKKAFLKFWKRLQFWVSKKEIFWKLQEDIMMSINYLKKYEIELFWKSLVFVSLDLSIIGILE